jgi:hypothetical protein
MMQFGIVEGMTFRARFDEGVALIIEPRASGRWVAKPVHVPW